MKVGEIATPLTKIASASSRHGIHDQQRQGGQGDDADRDGELTLQRHCQVQRADDEADDERTDGVDADDEARSTRLAQLLGDRHRADFRRCEDRADEDQGEGDDLDRPQPDRRTIACHVPAACTRGSVERCRMNAADPNARNSVLASIPASGNSATLRPTDKRRAGDIDELVRRRFEGEGRVEFRAVAEILGPARPHHRRNAGHGSGQQRRHEQRPDRPVLVGGDQQRGEGDHRNDRRRHDHPRLAEAVDQPRDLRRNDGVGQRIGGRDGAGQPVFAMGLRQHGDDADRRHGHRHACDEAGRREAFGARRAEDLAIGIGHGMLLDFRRRATYIRGVCKSR